MSTIPTAEGVTSREDLLLQIELTKWKWRLEKAKIQNKSLKKPQSKPNTSYIAESTTLRPSIQAQQPMGPGMATPVEDNAHAGGELENSVKQAQNFEQWLKKVRIISNR
jgi:hypothetical protein